MESDINLNLVQAALDKLRAVVADADSIQKNTQRQYQEAQNELAKWKAKYHLALKAKSPTFLDQTKFQYDRFTVITKNLKNLADEYQSQFQELRNNLFLWEEKVKQLNLERAKNNSITKPKIELLSNAELKEPIVIPKSTESTNEVEETLTFEEPLHNI